MGKRTKVGEMGLVPTNNYSLRLEDVEARMSKDDTRMWIPWTFMVLTPTDLEGKVCRIATGLGNPAGEQLTQEILLALGASREEEVPLENVEEMTAFLQKFIGKVMNATVEIREGNDGISRNSIPFGGAKPSDKASEGANW
jgi:hypothetical protein